MTPARRNQNWLRGIFSELFGNEWMERSNMTAPAVNIIENEDDYCVEVAAPGMTREDFKININEDNELVISMEKRSESRQGDQPQQQPQQEQRDGQGQNEEQSRSREGEQTLQTRPGQDKPARRQGTYLRREFSYSQFQQSLILPDNVDKDNIRARMENGVLTIEIPKRKQSEMAPASRQIDIE